MSRPSTSSLARGLRRGCPAQAGHDGPERPAEHPCSKGIGHVRPRNLESEILTEIAAAGDEAALEAVRVAALGKKGSISALLSTLGKMSPDERKTQGAAINLAKDKVTQALTARRDILK